MFLVLNIHDQREDEEIRLTDFSQVLLQTKKKQALRYCSNFQIEKGHVKFTR